MNWIRLMTKNPSELRPTSDTIYQAAQYLAMVAQAFIPSKEDDSHTNADWFAKRNWLLSNAIISPNGLIHVALDYTLLVLIICTDKLEPIAEVELSGKTRLEGFNWLNNQLWKLGLEVDNFEMELHYDIPDHPVLHGATFEMDIPKYFLELANYRTNGYNILNEVTAKFKDKSTNRIWPHHFDDGIIVNTKRDNESVIALISMGLAMPDAYYDQPYFYVNAWTKNGIDYSTIAPLKSKGKWHEKDWKGQVLLSEDIAKLLTHDEQYETSLAFLDEAIDNALKLMS